MSSVFQLDDETKRLLTLDHFLQDISIPEFVDRLSKQNVRYKSKFNNGVEYIDPKPYIRTFELVQKQLDKLSQECDSRKSRLEGQARSRAIRHSENVMKLNTDASTFEKKYDKLSQNVSKLYATKISPLQERLTQANSLKQHSDDLIMLTRCYNDYYTQSKTPDMMQNYASTDIKRVAHVLSNLLALSDKLAEDEAKMPNARVARELIEKDAHKFEDEQLKSFASYYKQKNVARTRAIADALFEFNGGANIVDLFVKNDAIFGKFRGSGQFSLGSDYWKQLGMPDNTGYGLDDDTSSLLESVSEQFDSELDTITEIFLQNSSTVLKSLITKLFTDIIQSRISYLVKLASSYSKLAFVRVLHLTSAETYHLTVSKMSTSLEKRKLDLGDVLDRCYINTFSPYLKEDSYFKVEKANLLALLSSLDMSKDPAMEKAVQKHALSDKIIAFKEKRTSDDPESEDQMLKNVENSQQQDTFKEKAKKLVSHGSIRHFTSISGFIHNSSWRERLRRSGMSSHLSMNSNASDDALDPSVPNSPVSSRLTPLSRCQRMLSYVSEALNRCIELVPSKINEYSMDIFEIMMYKMGPSFILTEMEALYLNNVMLPRQKLNSFFGSSSVNIKLEFLSDFSSIVFQIYLFSLVVRKTFYPLLLNEGVKARIVNLFNGFVQDMEIALNITLDSIIDLVEANVDNILHGQNNEDYCPRTQNIVIDKTDTCDKLVQFMEYTLKCIRVYISPNPLFEFELIRRISSSLLMALIEHLRQVKVNSTGSLILTQDVIHYISIFDSFNFEDLKRKRDSAMKGVSTSIGSTEEVNSIKDEFLVLKELANLFSCQPELLKDLCNEGKLSSVKRSILREYIRNRIDFKESFLDGI